MLLSTAYYLHLLVPNFIALIPLLLWLDRRVESSPRAIFGPAFLYFGLLTSLINIHFYATRVDLTWLAGLLYLGFSTALAVKLGLCVTLIGWLRRRTGWSYALLLPAVWLSAEWLQTFGDLRLTGDHIAYSMSGHPFMIQFADLVGPYGVGAFVLVSNALLLEVWRGDRRRALWLFGGLLAAVLIYDGWAWNRTRPTTGSLRVALIQPNIGLAVKRFQANTQLDQWRKLEQLSRQAAEAEADLIVWPESSTPWPIHQRLGQPETYRLPELEMLARELGKPFLAGVEYYVEREPARYDAYNAAVIVDSRGKLDPTWAAKRYLVPFVERFPFDDQLGKPFDRVEADWAHWVAGPFEPGPSESLLQLDGIRIGLQVCMEQLFPEMTRQLHRQGAELQIVITNDAWWNRTLFQGYQADILRMRAIESRTPFVRVANTGISGFVDERGRYHQRTALFVPAMEIREVVRRSERTVYGRVGDGVAWLALLGLAAALVRARVARIA